MKSNDLSLEPMADVSKLLVSRNQLTLIMGQ